MPRERTTDRTRNAALHNRLMLIANSDGRDLELPGLAVRISNAPLFREADGSLHQAIRLRLAADDSASARSARIGVENAWHDELPIADGATATEYLYVPEVAADTQHRIELRSGSEVVGSTSFTVTPQRKWTVHLIHHSHYDIGYTDPQNTVLAAQLSYIDTALEMATATDDWPEDSRFRWTIEVAWPLRHWLRTRSAARRDDLVRRRARPRHRRHVVATVGGNPGPVARHHARPAGPGQFRDGRRFNR